MSTQEQAYKESLNELLDAFEKIEPVLQKAKQARKELSQDDYIKLLEEQNKILKDRVQVLEDHNVATSNSCCPWDSYTGSGGSSTSSVYGSSFSWNSWITFFICLWVFLVFLG